MRRGLDSIMRTVAAALFLLSPPTSATASPRQLNCTLTIRESIADSNFTAAENRSIAVIVDQAKKTISVFEDGAAQAFDHVTFSQLTINGYTNTRSLGMDTSAGNLVLQSYGPNSNKTEFGTCNLK